MLRVPRPYQISLVNGLAQKINQGKNPVLAQLATGGGKTVSFALLIHRYLQKQQKKVLILVHREELLKQACSTLFQWYEISAAPVTARSKYLPNVMVYVAMVETANNRMKKNPKYFGNVGLMIVDEAHIGNFKKLYNSFPGAWIIGFTATPISGSKKDPLKNHFRDIVCGIDIPDLISSGSLVRNKTYHIQNISREDLKIKNGEYDESQMASTFSSSRHVQNCIGAYQLLALGTKTIVFNCNVEHSKIVDETFRRFGYNSRHLDGMAEDAYRQDTLAWFKKTPNAILNNIGILTTGFDEPSVQTVIVNKSTLSVPLWLQMTGRGSRPFPGKDYFAIVDMGGNAMAHGDWSISRDWSYEFFNPEKPKSGGEAPQKICIGCEAVIHASIRICRFCGADNSRVPVYDETRIKWELLTSSKPVSINIKAMIKQYQDQGRHLYYCLHMIKNRVILHAQKVWGVRKLDEKSADRIHAAYQEHVRLWCQESKKEYNYWHMNKSREWMQQELERVYKIKKENAS